MNMKQFIMICVITGLPSFALADRGQTQSSLEQNISQIETKLASMVVLMKKVSKARDFKVRDDLIAQHILQLNSLVVEMRVIGNNTLQNIYGKTAKVKTKSLQARVTNLEKRLDLIQVTLEQLVESRQAERAQRHGHL